MPSRPREGRSKPSPEQIPGPARNSVLPAGRCQSSSQRVPSPTALRMAEPMPSRPREGRSKPSPEGIPGPARNSATPTGDVSRRPSNHPIPPPATRFAILRMPERLPSWLSQSRSKSRNGGTTRASINSVVPSDRCRPRRPNSTILRCRIPAPPAASSTVARNARYDIHPDTTSRNP